MPPNSMLKSGTVMVISSPSTTTASGLTARTSAFKITCSTVSPHGNVTGTNAIEIPKVLHLDRDGTSTDRVVIPGYKHKGVLRVLSRIVTSSFYYNVLRFVLLAFPLSRPDSNRASTVYCDRCVWYSEKQRQCRL